MPRPEVGMASLFNVSLGSPEPTDQEISEALLGPWNPPRQSWNKFRVPAFPLALLIEKFGAQFLTKNCSPYVTHFDLGGGRRQELQENGQQVFGNAGKWQTP